MWPKKNEKRSPLKDRPLRLPGQSIQDQMDDLFIEGYIHNIYVGMFAVLVASFDWIWAFSKAPRAPWVTTAIAAAVLVICAVRAYRTFQKIETLKLGRDGERIVAEQLDVLKQQGAVILHDVVADNFNLDHVILSKKGIFVAETKTWSKPGKGNPTITFDGSILLKNGLTPDRDPIAQAEMNSRWLSKALQASTGKTYAVRPVVLFPGWFVERMPRGCTVWVLEPKALPSFVEHEPVKISDSDLHLAAYHLTRLIRTTPH